MSETGTPTLEELAQRHKERQAQTSPEDDARTSETTEPGLVTRECGDCELAFSYEPLFFKGHEVAVRRVCPACAEIRIRKSELLGQRQHEYDLQLEGVDRENAIRQILHEAGANPWEHGHATLDNFDTGECGPRPLGAAREFAAAVLGAGKYDPVRGLYLHGETGPGKTHLAAGIMRWLVENGYTAKRIVFDHAAGLIARIQDTYGRKDERTIDVLERRTSAGLWILDDFGTERVSDDVVRHLTVIFTERGPRPTLITSNFSPDRLDRERPELVRVVSRLGPKYFRTVEVKGRDRRFD
jgi:DNA replication protein DnaC